MFSFGVDHNVGAGDAVSISGASASQQSAAAASTITNFSVQSLMDDQLPVGSDDDESKSCPCCGESVNKGKKILS